MRRLLFAFALFAAPALHAQTSCPTAAPFGTWSVTNSCAPAATCVAGAPVTLFIVEQPAPLYPCQAGQPCPPRYYKLQACDTVTWHFGDGSPDATVTQSYMITHTYATPGIYSATATVANTLGSIHGDGDVVIDSGPAMTPPPAAGTATLTPTSIQVTAGTPVSLRLDISPAAATNMVIPLQSSSPDVAAVPAAVTVAAGQSSATFTARSLHAGRARITATVSGRGAPVAAIGVVDPVAVSAEPSSVTVIAGAHGSLTISVQPSSATAQTVTLRSSRPDIATVPESLTIPGGGSATLDVHALAGGTTTIWIVTDGFALPVDVTVVVPRRRATR
jgi:uncharacterized protein YjdB